ncbi:C-terminal PDZ domain ligand of neuronal nitric oxide synthase, isoform CRA_c [Rattus norvegicus]|uniref:C-terminal PDZ domain ligand of neuronal nitric oxide synthase, isoform CRA_c n=1 Tax=Rattus norvegicus TaxID=10116 RepID=A6IDP7_RAT|nr:C-terminal PDZ domain ligand of neuronal nitric oxide synthase, isoform CRA_c [Rattus norvegicus]
MSDACHPNVFAREEKTTTITHKTQSFPGNHGMPLTRGHLSSVLDSAGPGFCRTTSSLLLVFYTRKAVSRRRVWRPRVRILPFTQPQIIAMHLLMKLNCCFRALLQLVFFSLSN